MSERQRGHRDAAALGASTAFPNEGWGQKEATFTHQSPLGWARSTQRVTSVFQTQAGASVPQLCPGSRQGWRAASPPGAALAVFISHPATC